MGIDVVNLECIFCRQGVWANCFSAEGKMDCFKKTPFSYEMPFITTGIFIGMLIGWLVF